MTYEDQPTLGFGKDTLKKKSKTVAELSQEVLYKVIFGVVGKSLKFEIWFRSQLERAKVDQNYQRILSEKQLAKYGEVDMTLLIPLIVSRRPISLGEELGGDHIIDGQHKALLYYNGTKLLTFEQEKEYGGIPVMILEHEENATFQEVQEKEAKVFKALNTLRKKLELVDQLRASVCENDESPENKTAVHVLSVMQAIDLNYDNFGSESVNLRKVETFNQLYYAITADYPMDASGLVKIQGGKDFWEKVFGKKKTGIVHGTAFRSICFLDRFINEGLTGKRRESFYAWCINELSKQFNQKSLVSSSGSFDAPRWALYKVILKYNEMTTNEHGNAGSAFIIGPKTLYDAIKNSGRDGKGESRFMHPDEDMMICMFGLTGRELDDWRSSVVELREYFSKIKKQKTKSNTVTP
jgi:hypothetical protein